MKALILTITSGEGHNAIARAMADCLKDKGCDVMTHDLFKGISRTSAKAFNDGYLFICSRSLKFANGMYKRMLKRNPARKKHSVAHMLSRSGMPGLKRVISEYNPDVILCVPVCAAILMDKLKRELQKEQKKEVTPGIPPVVSINYDYIVTPYCECCTGIDYVISPGQQLNEELLRKGYAQEQIKHFGSPVHTKFSKHMDKKTARQEIGIDPDMFTVFAMNGGLGYGSTFDIVKNLALSKNEFQIVIVNGNNKQTKASIDAFIEETGAKNIVNLGFVNNVDVVMSAADLLIGKMGGVSVTEAINKRVPILAIKKLPWQEHYNMLYMTELGVCEHIKDMTKIYEYVDEFIAHPEKLQHMRECMDKMAKEDATERTVDLMIELANG